MDDLNKILPEDELVLWCQFLLETDKTSWAQLTADGLWGTDGLRLDLAAPEPSVQMYFYRCVRCISEPLSVNPGAPPRLRPALLRLIAHPAVRRDLLSRDEVHCLAWPTPDPPDASWLAWLLDNGFSPEVRMGVDDYGRTAWLEWRRQDGLVLHQAGADEQVSGMWLVAGGDPAAFYMTPEDAAEAAHDKEWADGIWAGCPGRLSARGTKPLHGVRVRCPE